MWNKLKIRLQSALWYVIHERLRGVNVTNLFSIATSHDININMIAAKLYKTKL